MWTDTDSDEEQVEDYAEPPPEFVADDSARYWRRRFCILAVGIVALVVLAWQFPVAQQPSKKAAAAASASMAALAKREALPSTAYGPSWPSPTPHKTVLASPTPAVTPTPTLASSAYPAPSVTPSAAAAGPPGCAPGDIVLSLFTSAPSYGQQALPAFSVYAVSTSKTACTLGYGAGSVQVVVTSAGHVVWDSAACMPAAAPQVQFTLGVPQLLTVSWNRHAVVPAGCAGSLPAGAAGTFDVVAMMAGQSSPVRTFELTK